MNSFFFFFKRINCKSDFNSFFNKIVYYFLKVFTENNIPVRIIQTTPCVFVQAKTGVASIRAPALF